MEKYFEDGSDVTEGQLLFRVGTPENDAELSQTRAALAESMTALAKALVENNPAASELQLEVEQNRELVKELEDAAAVGMIYAPKSGTLGAINAPIGMPVVANETLLATVGDIDSVVVKLDISDAEKQILSASDNLKITLRFSDGMSYSGAGNLKILGDSVETYFENPDELLILGTSAQIELAGVEISEALLVPEIAIQQNGDENFVFVADNKKAAVRKILLGDKIGGYFVVKDGLKAGEMLIVEGFEKLREGTPLNVDDK